MPKDGGIVTGTGGGKFGSPKRWTRPMNARPDREVYATSLLIAGVGSASHGRRPGLAIQMIVAKTDDGWAWRVGAMAAVRTINDRIGVAPTLSEAKAKAIAAARDIAQEAEQCPRESENHPPMGPAIWPGQK